MEQRPGFVYLVVLQSIFNPSRPETDEAFVGADNSPCRTAISVIHVPISVEPSRLPSFAQTLRLMATSRAMVEHNDYATKREIYYISKNWGECRFDEQAESDATMDDIEAIASTHGLSREQLRFYPESHGGSVAGRLTVIDRNPVTGATIEIDCANLGSGAYSIPRSVEHLVFCTDAQFVLAIETSGMFQRLNNHRF